MTGMGGLLPNLLLYLLKIAKLTIVNFLTPSGRYQDARKPLRYMSPSTWQPTYIYIKENRIHNNKRVKDGRGL